jgi:chromosome segregation ATPase
VSDPEFAKKFQAGLEKAQERFNSIAKLAAEVSSITGNQLASAIDAAVLKTVELADKQALLRKQIEGSATEQSDFLLDVRDVSKVYAELIDQTAEFYQNQGQDPTAIREILRQQEIFASENRILEQQKSLTEKLKDAEEKLGQLREKNGESQSRRSRQLTLEALSSGLQQSVLSIESQSVQDNTDAVSELTSEIAGLNFEIARLNATRENLQTQFTDPQGFAVRQRGIGFTQGLAPVDFMASPFSAANVAIREARSYLPATGEVLSGPGMTEAVRAGIEKALQNVLPALKEGQNGVKDAIKHQDTKARAGQ